MVKRLDPFTTGVLFCSDMLLLNSSCFCYSLVLECVWPRLFPVSICCCCCACACEGSGCYLLFTFLPASFFYYSPI
ncbi:hypothetical protein QBC37DRAFT_412003 [Rhypophila decipiens]|uniref:Uncharacterized protein n=1 Tax=Rhypophila decipiens TaxID=261697 RepID=A0AAN7BEV6_9PEZI|nr:hypothetical protein QBC37DRAFT_412003 [Rhypophila decipiens]